jgi:ElaB/YqjD/DUF883 family membrane-anchored ribosome-binding protein
MTSTERETGQGPGLTEKASASVQDAASTAQEKAGELKERGQHHLADQLDQRSSAVGSQTRTMAQAVRRSSEQLRQDGNDTPARLAEQAADRIEQLGSYLESKRGEEMLRDVEDFARRRPWLVAGIGVVAGLAASRFLKASSERRYEASGRMDRGDFGSVRSIGDGSSYDPGATETDPASAPISRELQRGA